MAHGVVRPRHCCLSHYGTSDRERAACCMLSPTASFLPVYYESRMRRIQEWASEREVRRGIEAVVLV